MVPVSTLQPCFSAFARWWSLWRHLPLTSPANGQSHGWPAHQCLFERFRPHKHLQSLHTTHASGMWFEEIHQRTLQLLISTNSDALMRTGLEPLHTLFWIPLQPLFQTPELVLRIWQTSTWKQGAPGRPLSSACLAIYTRVVVLSATSAGITGLENQCKGCITASIMYAVTCFMGRKPDGVLVKQIVNGSDISPAMTFGHANEDLACQLYLLGHQQQHPDVRVDQIGLHVDLDRLFLAASPDDLADSPECGSGLLERDTTLRNTTTWSAFESSWREHFLELSDPVPTRVVPLNLMWSCIIHRKRNIDYQSNCLSGCIEGDKREGYFRNMYCQKWCNVSVFCEILLPDFYIVD